MGNAAQTFEELRIYQSARELVKEVYSVSRTSPFSRDRALVDQIRRASVSTMANIAEGFERGSKAEFIQFLYIAKGSSGEVRALLEVASDQAFIAKPEYERLRTNAIHLSAMISRFIAALQRSNYPGEKTNRVRRLKTSNPKPI